jgi:hypothetical protein
MNFTSLKKSTAFKFNRKELKRLIKTSRKKPVAIQTVGVLASASLFGSYDISRNLSQKLNKAHKNLEIIIFENLKDDFVTQHYNTFSEKDFGMFGKAKAQNLIDFIDTKYDILINYCSSESVFTNVVALRSQATFKVSFANEELADLYDFTIDVDSNKVDIFNDELAKYLEILELI